MLKTDTFAGFHWWAGPWLGPRARQLLPLVAIAVLVGSLRFLTISFTNDHFVHLTAAQQVLFGDWPTRDFIDIGRPLQILASAAGQQWLGRTLFAEAIVSICSTTAVRSFPAITV